MALVLADRVLETSTSEGLGTFALAGAQTGYQTFSNGIGNGNTCYYTINGQTTEQWEVGIGTVSANTLARTTLISSNTGSFINFVAGVKNVFVTQPASKSIYKDANGNAIPLGSASATQLDITAQGDLRLQDTTGGEYVAIQAPATLASSYTLTMPTDDGTAGQALITDGSGVLSWSTAASGDVYGPASATDNAIARYDGTTGKIIQNSAVTIDDTGNVAGVGTLSASGQLTLTNASDYNLYASGVGKNFMQGALGIGAVPTATVMNLTANTNPTGGTALTGISQTSTIQSDVTASYYANITTPSTAAAAFTLTNINHYRAVQGTFGAGSTVTNQYGFFAGASLVGATNNYGFNSSIPSGTGRYNFYAAGTADNYFAGSVGIGTTTPRVPLAFAATVGTAGVPTKIRLFDDGASNFYGFGISIGSLDITGGTGGDVTLYANGATERLRVASTGVISLGAAVGSESLRVTPVASSVNYWDAYGNSTGNPTLFYANGSDTNVNAQFSTKGTGAHKFTTNGLGSPVTQFVVSHTASAVNYLQVTGGATGNDPVISAQGSDTNINLIYNSKGSNSHIFRTQGGSATQVVIQNVASAVNYFILKGSATGAASQIAVDGSDTNIDIALTTKGTGVVQYGTYTAGIIAQAGSISIKDAAGNTRRLLVG